MKAVKGSFGNVSVIAKRLNCERQTVYNWLDKDGDLENMVKGERETIVDLAENKLVERINDGSESMISLALKTLGKNRGYTEKQEVEHSGSIEERVRNMTEEERAKRKKELLQKLEREKQEK